MPLALLPPSLLRRMVSSNRSLKSPSACALFLHAPACLQEGRKVLEELAWPADRLAKEHRCAPLPAAFLILLLHSCTHKSMAQGAALALLAARSLRSVSPRQTLTVLPCHQCRELKAEVDRLRGETVASAATRTGAFHACSCCLALFCLLPAAACRCCSRASSPDRRLPSGPDSCPQHCPSLVLPCPCPHGAVSDVDDELDTREREKLAKEGQRDEALRRHNKLRWVGGRAGGWAGGWVDMQVGGWAGGWAGRRMGGRAGGRLAGWV